MNKITLNRQKTGNFLALTVMIAVFAVYLPLILKINFQQNDDFYYFATVNSFLRGNFSLPDKMAPTFYTQGFLGGLFALLLGVEHLAVLTLTVSLLCLILLFSIIKNRFNQSVVISLAISLLLFFNPLFQYSILGFMTDNYLLLFVLLSLFYYLQYSAHLKKYALVLCTLYWVIGFFVKQTILILPLAYLIHSLLRKDKKCLTVQAFSFLAAVFLYLYIFPQTMEMHEKVLQFKHLSEFNYSYAIFYGILLYIAAFIWPLMFPAICRVFLLNRKKVIYWLLCSIILFILLNHFYDPMSVSWGEFPFFENVFERTGFLPRAINGTKYMFRGNFDLYRYWELISKIILAGYLASVFINKTYKRIIQDVNFYIIVIFIGLMIATYTFYDRYIIFILPSAILLMIPEYSQLILSGGNEAKISNIFRISIGILLAVFILFLMYFSYFLANDYVLGQSYVWSRSRDLVKTGIYPSKIYSNRAWNQSFDSKIYSADYIFSYDSPKTISPDLSNYELIETKQINFIFNPFIEPNIYLYRKKLL